MYIFIIFVILIILVFFLAFIVSKILILNQKKTKKKSYKGKPLTKYLINDENKIENLKEPIIPISSIYEVSEHPGANKSLYSTNKKARSTGHNLIVGGSGRGKTEKIVEPIIFFNAQIKHNDDKPTMVITDTSLNKGESLYSKYKNFLIENGYKVKLINLEGDINPADEAIDSDFFNPMKVIFQSKDNPDLLAKNIETFANGLLPHDGLTNDPYWTNSSRKLIQGFIYYMIESNNYDEDSFNIKNLASLFSEDFQNVAAELHLGKFDKASKYTKPLLISMYSEKELYKINNNISGILSTITAQIQIFNRPLLELLTSSCTFELEELIEEPTIIFIQSKLDHSDSSSMTFIDLFVKNLSDYKMKNKGKRDLLILLDEFNSFPIVDKLPYYLNQGRKYGLFFTLLVQSFTPIRDKYKPYGGLALSNFYNKIILGSEENQDNYEILQDFKEEVKSISISTNNRGITNSSETEKMKEGINTLDIKTLHNEEAFVILRGHPPFKSYIDIIGKLDLGIEVYLDKMKTPNPKPKVVKVLSINELRSKYGSNDAKEASFERSEEVKSKDSNRKGFDKMKKEVLQAFSIYFKSEQKDKFKQDFIDKLSYELWLDPRTGRYDVWITIHQKLISLKSTDISNEDFNTIKSLLRKSAPEDIKDMWFK